MEYITQREGVRPITITTDARKFPNSISYKNMRQQIEMQVLNEKYATQHAVGLVAWFEFDSNVIDHQKLATITMAAG